MKKVNPHYRVSFNNECYSKEFDYSPITIELDELKHRKLSKEDIHKITLWKLNRFPSISDETLKKLNSLESKGPIDREKTRDVLKALISSDGVRLPMASTYLRFFNPNVYQIIDARAYRAAFDYKKQTDYNKVNVDESIDIYFIYLDKLKEIANKGYHGLKVYFQDLDRFLYDIDKLAKFKINDKSLSQDGYTKKVLEIVEEFKKNIATKGK